jgi:ribose/xylose/arabinose/galactoside ABC-type transport system permease subunit
VRRAVEAVYLRPREVYPFAILGLAALGMIVLPKLTSGTVTVINVYDIGQIFADYGLIALALGLAMMAGEYDLSTAGGYALGAVVAVKLAGTSPLLGLAAALGIGFLAGLVQGGIVARLSMSAIPVTLGGYLILFGLNQELAGSKTVSLDNPTIGLTLDDPILEVFSLRSLICLGIFAAVFLMLRFTRLGAELRAVGGDRRASRTAGVSVGRVLIGVLIVSGLCSTAAGALKAFSLASANPDIGLTPLIFATIAALLGGVSLTGGRGSVIGILAGVLSYATLQETLAIIGAEDWQSLLTTGSLLLIVAALTAPHLKRELTGLMTRLRGRLAPARTPAQPSTGGTE